MQSKETQVVDGHDGMVLSNGLVEATIPLGFGPRILSFQVPDGENVFSVFADDFQPGPADVFRMYGGHRFWVAPEDPVRTYRPDNRPVQTTWRDEALVVSQSIDPATELQKELVISMPADQPRMRVRHRLVNQANVPQEVALWGLSVMGQGGRSCVPQEEYRDHGDSLLPARSMALWHYTDLSDSRWRFHRSFLELRHDPSLLTKQKVGMLNRQGWAAYLWQDWCFVKTIAWQEGARYPDLGCNTEVFTEALMLELESLGPLCTLDPGAVAEHDETWWLFPAPRVAADQAVDWETLLAPMLQQVLANGGSGGTSGNEAVEV